MASENVFEVKRWFHKKSRLCSSNRYWVRTCSLKNRVVTPLVPSVRCFLNNISSNQGSYIEVHLNAAVFYFRLIMVSNLFPLIKRVILRFTCILYSFLLSLDYNFFLLFLFVFWLLKYYLEKNVTHFTLKENTDG